MQDGLLQNRLKNFVYEKEVGDDDEKEAHEEAKEPQNVELFGRHQDNVIHIHRLFGTESEEAYHQKYSIIIKKNTMTSLDYLLA